MSKREYVGVCGVDSGLIWIGDPCYIRQHPQLFCGGQTVLEGEQPKGVRSFMSRGEITYNDPNAKGVKLPDRWNELCKKLDHIPQEMYSGIITDNHIGDGGFPVYVTKDKDGRVRKLEILFKYD
jgi:hypothetical protein